MNSLIGKFAITFWLLFIAVIAPMVIFNHTNYSDVLEAEDRSKIELVTNTLHPMIETYLSFEQYELLSETLDIFFRNSTIISVVLTDIHEKPIYEKHRSPSDTKGSITLSKRVQDPITKEPLGTLYIRYSNAHSQELTNKLFDQLLLLSLFALMLFSFAFLYFRKQFFLLREISEWIGGYSFSTTTKPFKYTSHNREIQTIISSANKMLGTIENYKEQMENINAQLEQRIEIEVAQRRQKEQLLIHQSRLAAMGEMIENIAHQWRQPLNVIGLAMSNIEMKRQLGLLDDAELQNNNDIITTNITFMSNTIDDFRNFFNLNKEHVTFKAIKPINDIFHLLSEQLNFAKITYAVDNNCNEEIYGVVNEFKQVILNIINNAKDAIASHEGGGKIDVHLRCEKNHLFIDIADTGGGVPPEIIPRIFEPYFTTKFQKQGTGIGLYMSKVIVEQHFGGNISVSNNDLGAVFTIQLPLRHQ